MADSSPDDLARLNAEIAEAKRKLANLHHDGERHFIDDAPVHPELPQALHDVIAAAERYHGATVEKPVPSGDTGDPLAELEARIARCRELAKDPHKDEQHFIDG